MHSLLLLCLAGGAAAMGGQRLTSEYHQANKGSMWAAYKAAHGKTYRDVPEERRREAIFHANMEKAVTMQAANPHATFGPTVMSDRAPEEMVFAKGLAKAPEAAMQATYEEPQGRYQEAADKLSAMMNTDAADDAACHDKHELLDWSKVGVVTQVKMQGSCGGCWAFSAVAALESQWAIMGHDLVSLSEEQVLECANGPDAAHCNACDGGFSYEAYDYILKHFNGAVTTEDAYPFKLGKYQKGMEIPQCPGMSAFPSTGATMTGYEFVKADEVSLYVALADFGPVQVNVAAEHWQSYQGGIMTDCMNQGKGQVDHAVLLVGHGYDVASQMPYWIIKNSWSTTWGENGYIRLQYGADMCQIISGGLKPVRPVVAQAPGKLGSVPIEFSSPLDARSTPEYIEPVRPDPFNIPPPPKDPKQEVYGVCIAGDDCECPSWLGWMGIGPSKILGICDEPLILLIIVVFALGALAGSGCCGLCAKQRRRARYAKV
eukprot:TRINITY_DN280_c6_g1_i1.p1 TRINITY_DN280_c6_g1~~TRINITY_DN280_c6_g1_i1.p1  ORF type:complete len:488 (+),score=166.69 TRINITY_DN280_c6_g1_i1:92-1555(+)